MDKNQSRTSIRISLYPHHKENLENIAAKYSCTYNGKPSVSSMITKIADGSLVIKENTVSQYQVLNSSCIRLDIKVPTDLKGTIHVISNEIYQANGNILSIDLKTKNYLGIFQFIISIHNKELLKLLKALYRIKFNNLSIFNSNEELTGKMVQIQPGYESLDNFKEQRFIAEINCIIGFKILIHNEPGVLANITKIIAEQHIFISSIRQIFSSNNDITTIYLSLLFKIKSNNHIEKEINKIFSIEEDIKKLPYIDRIEKLNIELND